MQVVSIAECSKQPIVFKTFVFFLFLTGRLRQVLLYMYYKRQLAKMIRKIWH